MNDYTFSQYDLRIVTEGEAIAAHYNIHTTLVKSMLGTDLTNIASDAAQIGGREVYASGGETHGLVKSSFHSSFLGTYECTIENV